jgi:hypothetical protein
VTRNRYLLFSYCCVLSKDLFACSYNYVSMGLNEDVDKMTEWLTQEQITNILLQRMDAEESQWNMDGRA